MRLLAVIAALLLTACSPSIQEGDVVAMEYQPERITHSTMQIPHYTSQRIGNVTTMRLSHYTTVPLTSVDDEDWVITVGGYTSSGEYKEVVVYIDQELYESLSIGDHIVLDPSHEPEDPDVKVRSS